MENKAEDEIRKRWEQEARDKAGPEEEVAQRPKKRPRAIGYQNSAAAIEDVAMNDSELDVLVEATTGRNRPSTKTRGGVTKTRRAAGIRAKNRITELTEEGEEVVELD